MSTFKEAKAVIENTWSKGFVFRTFEGYQKKVLEEIGEVEEVYARKDQAKIEEEMGDLFLAVLQLSLKAEVDPEIALLKAVQKYKGRFKIFEDLMRPETDYHHYSEDELLAVWQNTKKVYNKLFYNKEV